MNSKDPPPVFWTSFSTWLGRCLAAETQGQVTHIFLVQKQNQARVREMAQSPKNPWIKKDTRVLRKLRKQLQEYFQGKRREFRVPMAFCGTPFQRQTWAVVRAIPYGQTISYKQVAQTLRKPKAYRAVGQAIHKNPLPILVPCHRVIGSNGALVGFAGGLELKKILLQREIWGQSTLSDKRHGGPRNGVRYKR